MKNEIVSFRIAKELYNIESFNEDCYFGYIASYDISTGGFTNCMYLKDHSTGICKGITINESYREFLAPTYQSLRKWLAKNISIVYSIVPTAKGTWQGMLRRGDLIINGESYEDVEEELVFNILKMIENE